MGDPWEVYALDELHCGHVATDFTKIRCSETATRLPAPR
jgi:hypothetical protein